MGSSNSKPSKAPSNAPKPHSKQCSTPPSSHPSKRQHRPAVPLKPSDPQLINNWRPWAPTGKPALPLGPSQFGTLPRPDVLTQLCLYDHMYTYSLLTWAAYVRKVLALTRNYEFMRSYFTPDAHACWSRLEKGKAWAEGSRRDGWRGGVLAFYRDPMYGSRCDWRHVANVLLPMLGLNVGNLPRFRYPSQMVPSASELAHARF